MSRRLVLLATLLCGLVLGACGSTASRAPTSTSASPSIQSTSKRFAGYVSMGAMRSMSAAWRVPAIRTGSQQGSASTWIGAIAETLGSTGGTSPFIQIGTLEQRLAPRVGAPVSDVYDAFWSDSHRDFHPLLIFPVHVGDAVVATMTLTHRRWHLIISDTTSGRHRSFGTVDEGTAHFNGAEWLQEDVTDARTFGALPYPDLAPTHVGDIRVNGRPPAVGQLVSSWLSLLGGGYLGPTSLRDDAFTIVHRHLSAAGARYLKIATVLDSSSLELATLLQRGLRRGMSSVRLRTAVSTFVRTVEANIVSLRSMHWPTDVSDLIRVDISDLAGQVRETRAALRRGPRAVLALLARRRLAHEERVLEIRRRLDVPGNIT